MLTQTEQVVYARVSDDAIVPSDYQNKLMYWRDKFKTGYFEIGDITNDIIVLCARTGMSVQQTQIFRAVGRYCGKSARTVRHYAETAAYFPEAMREEYEMLPFSHFVAAKQSGEKWKAVLDYARLNPSVTEDALRTMFLDEKICAHVDLCSPDVPSASHWYDSVTGEVLDYDRQPMIEAAIELGRAERAEQESPASKSCETSHSHLDVLSLIDKYLNLSERLMAMTLFSQIDDSLRREVQASISDSVRVVRKLAKSV